MARVPNAPISDAAIRAAFMMQAPKPRFDTAASVRTAKISPRKAPTASLSAYKPSLGEKLQDGIGSALSGVMGDRYARRFAARAMAPLNDLTPVGNATGIADAGTTFGHGITKGNLAQAALGAGAFALSVIPGSQGAKRVTGNVLGKLLKDEAGAIRAWHGSPHDFDKFSMDKIGTGEGAQAYGHGLYFAENRDVARDYQRQLGGITVGGTDPVGAEAYAHGVVQQHGGDAKKALSEHLDYVQRNKWDAPEETAVLQRWAQQGAPELGVGGKLYEVNIDANPEDFLDWDKVVEDQPDLAERIAPNRVGQAGQLYNDFANNLGSFPGDPAGRVRAAEELRKRGVKGIKYLDQGSRGAGNGTSNYVVFDDKLVSILNKH